MVAVPSLLLYNSMAPACLWFISRDKKDHRFRNRKEHVLFVDARKLGLMVDRRHRELTEADIRRISDAYHTWRAELKDRKNKYIPGFCKSASLDDIRKQACILTAGTDGRREHKQ